MGGGRGDGRPGRGEARPCAAARVSRPGQGLPGLPGRAGLGLHLPRLALRGGPPPPPPRRPLRPAPARLLRGAAQSRRKSRVPPPWPAQGRIQTLLSWLEACPFPAPGALGPGLAPSASPPSPGGRAVPRLAAATRGPPGRVLAGTADPAWAGAARLLLPVRGTREPRARAAGGALTGGFEGGRSCPELRHRPAFCVIAQAERSPRERAKLFTRVGSSLSWRFGRGAEPRADRGLAGGWAAVENGDRLPSAPAHQPRRCSTALAPFRCRENFPVGNGF